jgi:hypothetical protein
MNSYHFDIGNSTDGPIGLCAQVNAPSKERALELLHEALGEQHGIEDDELGNKEGIGYINVYFNTDLITAKDIDATESI